MLLNPFAKPPIRKKNTEELFSRKGFEYNSNKNNKKTKYYALKLKNC